MMIEFKNVSKAFEDIEAVEQVNMKVSRGSIYGLLGSNGAGKTTLLKMAAGIYLQDSGQVMVGGVPVYENTEIKNTIFYIPDYPYFFPQYTVMQMAQFYKNIYSGWNEERFNLLGEVFEINPKKKVHRLSKGMQRQVSFWLAFSAMPDVLILDEPLDGLDPVMRRKVKNLIIQDVAEREMTTIIASHNLREIEDICDHIGIIHRGKILIEKDLDDLKCDFHKIQVAFKKEPEELFKDANFDVLHTEKRGSVTLCIARGDEEKVTAYFEQYEPILFDLLPLTLEEIFIYEMGDAGYAIKNILV